MQIGREMSKLRAETHLLSKYGVHCAEFNDFVFSMPFQAALGFPQPPVGWGLGLLSRGRGVEHPPPSTVKVRMSTVIFLLTLCAFLARYGETFTFSVNTMHLTPVEAQ
jgi:hypothetical protein